VFNFNNSIFSVRLSVPSTAQIVFVSDLFVDDYIGGAELTTQALIDSSPYEVYKLHSSDVSIELLKENTDKFWIFGNFSQLNFQLIPPIVGNIRYSIVEYDYKYCIHRSPEKHHQVSGTPCDCANQMHGKMTSAFFYGSLGIWWMSEKQRDRYLTMFPFLEERQSVVLSSVFDDKTLDTIAQLRSKAPQERRGWLVIGSDSWIKGAEDGKQWCISQKKEHEVVWNVPYQTLLEKLSVAEGFVCLPPGGDTCPRAVIEAKLLGCKLQLNSNVQHKDEAWFSGDVSNVEKHLRSRAKDVFWPGIKAMIEHRSTISGYTTTYNCEKQKYPFIQSIKSMLEFCDEVCIVDGGSTDNTLELLTTLAYGWHTQTVEDLRCLSELSRASGETSYEFPEVFGSTGAKRDPRIKVKIIWRDWTSKHHAVFDGMQKAEARAMCTKDYCWQMDSDEVVHEVDAKRIPEICRSIPKNVDVVSLPVIEYWGGPEKVRIDTQPWKWRLSRNNPDITHGIPIELRCFDGAGEVYALPGTDGCDPISKATGKRIPHINFYTQDAEQARQQALRGNVSTLQQYEMWFNDVVSNVPSVFHYSWYNLPRKIKLYRDYWTQHWITLLGKEYEDTAETNMMFDVPWSQVTDEMIEQRATEFKQMGGWIWHNKWHGEMTPHITCYRTQPALMDGWPNT